MLAAPIRLVDPAGNERRLGVLTVYRAAGDTPFQAADETLLQLFASQAAIVIENTELHQTRLDKERLDTELNDARRVQTSLIPAHPLAIKGYQIAGLWHPAKQVSGDYYDYIRLDDGRVAFVIADVSGKGLDAALFMANTRSILRANAALGGSPDEIIFRTNNAVTADSSRGMFVTAFFGILDPLRRRFSYVNAGHNLPLWRHAATRTIQTLAGGNLALGIMAGIKFQAHELELQPRDLILLYTDGITEATDATGALYGMARLRQVLAASGDLRARQVIRTLDRSVREFTGAAPQSDDITVVGLGRV
jgi:sigma-B regulation protein RsbU (phosphoserine phosphatase)